MVFGIDDIIEDSALVSVLTAIFYAVWPSVSTIATEAIAAEPELIMIEELLGEEGVEAVAEINTSSTVQSGLPAYTQFYDEADKVYEMVSNTINIPDKESFIQKVSKLAGSIAKKIPAGSQGFINLIKDIVLAAYNNPDRAITVGAAAVGAAGLTYSMVQKIKESFDKGEQLPEDVQKLIKDGKITISDVQKTVTDATQSILPQGLISGIKSASSSSGLFG